MEGRGRKVENGRGVEEKARQREEKSRYWEKAASPKRNEWKIEHFRAKKQQIAPINKKEKISSWQAGK